MKTFERHLYAQALQAIIFTALAFVLLFFFFDFVDELEDLSNWRQFGYTLGAALVHVGLQIPAHLYELLPMAVLIGSVFVLSRLAANSEFVILRISGLTPGRALLTMLTLGLVASVFTFAVGEYLAPAADRAGRVLQARFLGDLTVGQTGVWLKDQEDGQTSAVNIAAVRPDGSLHGIYLYQFRASTQELESIIEAPRAIAQPGGWLLEDVTQRRFSAADSGKPEIQIKELPQWLWQTSISGATVSAALLNPSHMQAVDLWRYIRHLKKNQQNTQIYAIEFWRKLFYPLACLVMALLALPFAYLSARSGRITAQMFLGVVFGVSFFLLNNVFGFMGNLREWPPLMVASAPAMLYSLLALSMFAYMTDRR